MEFIMQLVSFDKCLCVPSSNAKVDHFCAFIVYVDQCYKYATVSFVATNSTLVLTTSRRREIVNNCCSIRSSETKDLRI